jgi:lysozyme
MKLSKRGLNLIKEFEDCKLRAYLDAVQVLTIGYGHTKGVKRGQTITQKEADRLLAEDVAEFEEGVNDAVKVPLTQNQFDALVVFSFNVGTGALKRSTLLKKLNAKNYVGAADELLKWNKAGGKVLRGLTRRRQAERKLFLESATPAVRLVDEPEEDTTDTVEPEAPTETKVSVVDGDVKVETSTAPPQKPEKVAIEKPEPKQFGPQLRNDGR